MIAIIRDFVGSALEAYRNWRRGDSLWGPKE